MDRPGELNQAIFNLMLLQETIQLEQARKQRRDKPAAATILARRSVYGKFVVRCSGDERFRYVETALNASTEILAVFNRARFVAALRSMGVPDAAIAEFSQTVTIDDDTHCLDQD